MTSEVALANRALQKIGGTRIESLSQDHPNARSVNAAFDLVRDAELRKHDWAFAIKRASIAADVSGPTWGDWNRYSLPNDFIRLLRDDETGQQVDFKPEGLYILSANSSPLEIRYVARIEDPNYFDAIFIEAFVAKLGAEICQEVTGSTSKKKDCEADYKDALAAARKYGAIEKGAQNFPEDAWINARR